MDGHTKVVNISLGNLLRLLTKEYGQIWDHIIAQVEYAYNDTLKKSTKKSPFEVVYGVHPRVIIELRDMKIGVEVNGVAKDIAPSLKEIHDIVRHTLEQNTTKKEAMGRYKEERCSICSWGLCYGPPE